MKKIFMLLASFATLWCISCSNDETTIEKTIEVVIPGMDISKFNISANGGENLIEIAPTDNWKMVSKTEWLTITPAEGTKENKEVTLTAEANPEFTNRTATVEVTVGNTTMTKTVVQEGTVREITIYGNDTLYFSPEETEIKVSPIIANVEIEIDEATLPSWIENVVLTKNPDHYYEALVTLKAKDYDDEIRTGSIILKDKSSDYSKKFTVICKNMEINGKYLNDWTNVPSFMGAKEFTVNVMRASNTEQDTLVAWWQGDYNLQTVPDVKISEVSGASLNAAVLTTTYHIEVKEYNNGWGSRNRRIHFYILPKSEAADFNPNKPADGIAITPDFRFTQENSASVFTAMSSDEESYSLKTGVPQEIRVTVDGSIIPGLEIRAIYNPVFYADEPANSMYSEEFPLTVDYVKIEAAENGFITYVYNITASQASVNSKGELVLCIMAKNPITGEYVRDEAGDIWRPFTSSMGEILLSAK